MGQHVVLKLVAYHPNNPDKHNLPTILSSIFVVNTATGHLSSIVDGTFLTALRTGAASAVATRYLHSKDANTLGVVGAGAQAVSQVHALSRVMSLETVLVYDVDPATQSNFPRRLGRWIGTKPRVISASLAEVVGKSDVVTTATSVAPGAGPVMPDLELKAHAHINAVGSDFPGKTELPMSVLKRSLVVPDFIDQALKEGECQVLTERDIELTLCDLVSQPEEYSKYREQLSVFDSTGFALEDYAVVMLFDRYAGELNCGTQVNLESIGRDSKNPYDFLNAAPTQNKAQSIK
ncbi:MAG: ornithine cyclodeaminase family protein, partial [Pseudomonadota bacterium]